MTPVCFPQANSRFGPPEGLTESQCQMIAAFSGTVDRGSCEGSKLIVVAWKPTPEDLARLAAGEPVFLTMLGGLAPHVLTTNFVEAINIA